MTIRRETAFDIIEGSTDSQTVLLAMVLSGLPKEEQIRQITEAFFRTWKQGSTELLDALERLFGENKVAFREHLRSLYARCARQYLFPSGFDRPELQRHIAQRVLEGWNWRWIHPDSFFTDKTSRLEMNPDARECFGFFYEVFIQAGNKEVEAALLTCLREYIEHSMEDWNPEDLDQWILEPTLPREVLEVLLHARLRLGGAHMTRVELHFLEPFNLHGRSKEAISLIRQLMEQTRRTDELAQMIVKDIRPIDDITGLRNPETPLSHRDRVKWVLEAPGTARVIIAFADGPNPAALRAVEDVRNAMILGVGDPTINIIISAS